MAKITVGGYSDLDVKQRTLPIGGTEPFTMGNTTFLPDKLVVTWSRTADAEHPRQPWRMVAMEIAGPRLSSGHAVPSDRRTCKFSNVDDAPRWALSLANSNIPALF